MTNQNHTDIPLLAADCLQFPDPRPAIAAHEGLVALSRDLSAERLLAAYKQGIFPWHEEGGLFFWFATAPRTVLYPERLHIGRSLAKTLRHKPYAVTANQNFLAVIAACAATPRPGQGGSWIAPNFQVAYTELHRLGRAHSFECWYPDEDGRLVLAGGLYGVQIGRVFFGESMFAWQSDASKIAFACAVPFLQRCGIRLIDCQQDTPHLARFGSQTVPFDDFQAALSELTAQPLDKPITSHLLKRQGINW
ncbi:leucyl/phenylalanyl-tRNA--protein transferase [Eikenella longinqua]|uniref:Leucyl/phenylalanyl-tRNA--protein transferase n=1 Tax=Eikenella longinqua TaxID=1795827 RepID=A0A1A9RUC3_9NEIS|nr:leucyl/phenylalanyl-tRNA--protein transferase [Eikenella longinqua]OAM26639.1 leucyl/phenylalanyl-tRNA--protein transferase [Eikenella longinqua]